MATTARVAEAAKDIIAPFLTSHKGDPDRDDWWAYCPVHSTPGVSKSREVASICFNDGSGHAFWNCLKPECPSNTGAGKWPFDKMVAYLKQRIASGEIVLPAEVIDLKSRKRVAAAPSTPITEAQVGAAAGRLLNNPKAIELLMKRRGINERSIAEIMIGLTEDKGSFTIPVLRPDGTLAGMRLWRHSAKDRNEAKMKWAAKGGDHPMLFSEEVRDYDEVLILEGEWDAALARQMGFPATSGTLGSGGWHDDWTALLAGKRVTFMYDPDGSGILGAEKHAQRLANSATPPKAIRVVREALPGDFTDLVMVHEYTASAIRKILDATEWVPVVKPLNAETAGTSLPTNGKPVPFEALTSRDSSDINVESTVLVNARVGQYRVPWVGDISCGNNQGTKCSGCPMEIGKGEANTIPLDISRTDRDHILPAIGVKDSEVVKHVAAVHGLRCNKIEVHREKDLDVEQLFCTAPVLGVTQDGSNSGTVITVYQVGSVSTKAGDILRIVGRSHPEPKRQDAVFMAWHKEDNDPLRERVALSEEEAELLNMFRAADDEPPFQKLMEVAGSLNGQFGIVDRDLMTAAYLLTYMSVLELPFRGNTIKGWIQGVVVGDTRTGKTAVAEALLKHIGLGAMIKCDVSSRAGLVGGSGTHDGNRYIKMGLLPRSDRRMAFLDEATNMLESQEMAKYMTDMRSSGKISLNLIDNGEFWARVRQVWITNPPNGYDLESQTHGGIGALGYLMGTQQDLSRFDWVYALAKNSDTTHTINRKTRRTTLSPYTSYAMRLLTEWVWTRKASDIVIEPEVETEIGATAQMLAERYSNDRYQVLPGNDAGLKIARMAAAIAAMQFSTENGSEVIVTLDHVEAAGELLDALLSCDDLGLAEYCAREHMIHETAMDNVGWLREKIESDVEYHNVCAWLFESSRTTRSANVAVTGALNAEEVVHQLVSRGLVLQDGDAIRLGPEARRLLRRLSAEGRIKPRRNSSGSDG